LRALAACAFVKETLVLHRVGAGARGI